MKKLLILVLSLCALNAHATLVDCDPKSKRVCNPSMKDKGYNPLLAPLPPPSVVFPPALPSTEASTSYKVELAFIEDNKEIQRETFTVTPYEPTYYSNLREVEYLSSYKLIKTENGEKSEKDFKTIKVGEKITLHLNESRDKSKVVVKVELFMRELDKVSVFETDFEPIYLPETTTIDLIQTGVVPLNEEKEIYNSETKENNPLKEKDKKVYKLNVKVTKL